MVLSGDSLTPLVPKYPSAEHAKAAASTTQFFSAESGVAAVLLVGACARGKATRDSDLDIVVLHALNVLEAEQLALVARWEQFQQRDATLEALVTVGKYAMVDLEFSTGRFAPKPRGHTTGPDPFELEIGNTLVYSVPFVERDAYFQHLKQQWLPYYAESLRKERLAQVHHYFQNNLEHIPLFLERGLHFQAFDRLCHAFQEFLQALFIAKRRYPIAYDKWIREQVEEILGLPGLYEQLPMLFEIRRFESHEIGAKAKDLRRLMEEYAVGETDP